MAHNVALTRQGGCGPSHRAASSGSFAVTEGKHDTMLFGKLVVTEAALRKLLSYGAVFLIVSGCVIAPQAPSPPRHPKRAVRQQQRPVDERAQKRYYDEGLQYYSAERYLSAKEAFEEVVDLGPHTALGLKAQENLRKIEKILKTLDELESK
jgi:TolA-binding protein